MIAVIVWAIKKYYTYSMMDLDTEDCRFWSGAGYSGIKKSVAMEKKVFQVVTDRLRNKDLQIKTICTDRHPGIASIIAKEYKDIEHQFDVWHLSKSVLKRLIYLSGSAFEVNSM